MRLETLPAGILGVVALALAGTAFAGAELVLVDGRVLSGVSVERKEDAYHLAGENGAVIAIPAALVREMRLTGGDAPPPTGLTFSRPAVLAGFDAPPPGRREMLAAFGRPPALFRPPSGTQIGNRLISGMIGTPFQARLSIGVPPSPSDTALRASTAMACA